MGVITKLGQKGGDAAIISYLDSRGYVFYASDSAQNTTVTGQTSFATTTPTFLLSVPENTTAVPLLSTLGQSGTVGGGAITVLMEIDNANRFSTGGTSETVFSTMSTGGKSNKSTLRSGATATDAYGIRIMGVTVGADVDTAEGASNELVWTPDAGLNYLVGPASWLIYTYAASTGPTWLWSVKWAEFPTSWLD